MSERNSSTLYPKSLFLRRCEEVSNLANSGNPFDWIDLAGRLRQLILDEQNLMDAANTYRMRIRFTVADCKPIWEEVPRLKKEDFISHGLQIDPKISKGRAKIQLSRSQFLKTPISYYGDEIILVKDAIKYAANIAGGVHYSKKPKKGYEKTAEYMNFPFSISQLRYIGRITLDGLDPLIQATSMEINEMHNS